MLSKNTRETAKIAKTLLVKLLKDAKKGKSALVVGLSGDLGAGKTQFTKSTAKHLGIKEKVSSPTFVIMKKYPIAEQVRYGTGPIKKKLPYKFLFHIDAYRLKNEKELLHLGWEKIIGDKEHLVFIEWPENVSKIIPSNARFIRIVGGKKESHRHFKLR